MRTARFIGAFIVALGLMAAPDDAWGQQRRVSLKMTTEPACAGNISPMQYGQFVEYLGALVPAMWGEKLDDGGFAGLSPYTFVYLKETDFKAKPWYPSGATNRGAFE